MIRKSVPNIFTVLNLFMGIIAIILVFSDTPVFTKLDNANLASIMVIVAMLMDGIDGRVARALNVQSEFGKELDSLSDVVSFGVAPAFIMYNVAFMELNPATAWITTAIFPICGALRLARFNVIEGIPGYFIGLPIPAAGGILCTLALFHQEINAYVLVISSLLLSYLMISRVKYPSFKKVALPKYAYAIALAIVVAAVVVSVLYPHYLSRMIFVPLVLYALYGTFQGLKRKR
ncbi:CDP-diacylglycerol--serine O-phosphatidyltransferase [Paenibacillus aurantius]|uniref:CDP-diacylglycerol--serine O-phosphatidyltransferase n=1 Tax=Paenibacillus aurantius TaxID=2918900 RepID=A0AA96RFX3_9BACL|nr:CDP-diacylglycerol--serine O-phosphatidyltransferase [Paenibacillus aurantius]WJH36394.1 CDP-diacylglycerol--serine O-phosphatidyltransferase [Paenibacillus sp. CC-CFT747]WNQ11713.1 CDP-diacylglycerol--serine O-phosphatidyltransferase [Paenibacillus aurantius]